MSPTLSHTMVFFNKSADLKRVSCPSGFHLLYFFLMLLCLIKNTLAVVPVRVGVVLDMNTNVGKMGMASMNIALEDFYAANPQFQTRLVLNSRDSNGDVISAAAEVVDLLRNVKVEAIIGPFTSMEAYFVIHLGQKAHVPIISFTATSPSLTSIQSSYFFRTVQSDSDQVSTISAIVEAFGWREVGLVYVDNEFGQGIVPFLAEALEENDVTIAYRSTIPSSATSDQIAAELYKLMSMHTRVFIVHMANPLGSSFFMEVNRLGMMSKDYAWIITDALTNPLNSMNPNVLECMEGVLGVRPYVPRTPKLEQFQEHYKKQLVLNNGTSELTIFGLWAYDTITAVAIAAENVVESIKNATFLMPNTSSDITDLDKFGVSSAGSDLIRALSNTSFQGLAGSFRFIAQELQSPPYEVVNVVGPGVRVVGYWTGKDGIVKELNTTKTPVSTSDSKFKSILWPGDRNSPPKGWVLPVNEKKLRVLVPVKDGFSEFVDVSWNSDNSTKVQGFCIDVFDAVIKALPYGVPYEYIPYATENRTTAGTYDDMVYQVYLKNYDAFVGDLTIIANRSKFVDFTLPFTESGVSMLVPYINNNDKAWLFLTPLTWQLWLTTFCSFVTIGIVIWILEHKERDTEFRGSLRHQAGMIMWYSFSTMVFSQREIIRNNFARIIMIFWFFVVLILTQSYTANLASLLTVQQLTPSITDIQTLIKTNAQVGYQEGSFVLGFLLNKNFSSSRMLVYKSPEELNELFAKGSIAAAFDELPYIKLFLAKYCSQYTMTGPIYKTDGFGFVFPTGSPLVSDISKAVLNVIESDIMFQIEKRWLGDSSSCPSNPFSPSNNSLGLESFMGLFAIVGVIAAAFVLVHIGFFLYRERDLLRNANDTVWGRMTGLCQKFIEGYRSTPESTPVLAQGRSGTSNAGSSGRSMGVVVPIDESTREPEAQEEMENLPDPQGHAQVIELVSEGGRLLNN